MFTIPISSQADLLSALDYIAGYYSIPMNSVELFVVIKLCLCHCSPDGRVVEVAFDDKKRPHPKISFKVILVKIPLLASENHYLTVRVNKTAIKGLSDWEYITSSV